MAESRRNLSGKGLPESLRAFDRNQQTSPNGQILQAFEIQLVLDYLDLAESLAARFATKGRERDDLKQVAYLGLVKAAIAFDDSKGTSFPAFASPTITGELKRYLRDRCWVVRPPRRVQDLRAALLRCEPQLTQSLGRRPTPAELARELDEPVQAVQEAWAAASSMHPISLDASDFNGEGASLGEFLTSRDLSFERIEELICLQQAMRELSGPDRELLYRRYFLEESQEELGKRFGVSQMQISRRLSKILVRLQQRLSDVDAQSRPRSLTASRTS